MDMTRRRFLQYGVGAGAALALPWRARIPLATAAKGGKLAKYVQPVPLPGAGIVVATPSGPNQYSFSQTEIARQLHPDLPPTPLWAYDDGSGLEGQAGSVGMAVVAHSGTPTDVQFTHDLPAEYPSWIPVDTRLTPLGNQVRVMTHLHGGFGAADSDGNPAVTPNVFGPGQTQTVHYTNQQPQMPASLLWFHDHGLGATRLNVFAGLAAAYILRDEHDTGAEPNPIGIPGGVCEIPLVVQDRQFNPDGIFPTRPATSLGRPDRRVLRRRDARQRQGLAVPRGRAAHTASDPERLQREDPRSRHRGPGFWQIGAEGACGTSRAVEGDGAGARRAVGHPRRLQQVRRQDAGDEEPQTRRSRW